MPCFTSSCMLHLYNSYTRTQSSLFLLWLRCRRRLNTFTHELRRMRTTHTPLNVQAEQQIAIVCVCIIVISLHLFPECTKVCRPHFHSLALELVVWHVEGRPVESPVVPPLEQDGLELLHAQQLVLRIPFVYFKSTVYTNLITKCFLRCRRPRG